MNILIADDDKAFVELVAGRLRQQGHVVGVAYDAVQVMMIAVRNPPALILLDVQMPGGSGIETLRKLKNSAKTSAVPVVVITASDSGELEATARSLGAAAYLRKPVPFDTLQQALASCFPPAAPTSES